MIPAKKKEAVLSMYQHGQRYKEIADILLLSPNTVKSICRRSGIRQLQADEFTLGLCRNCGTPLEQNPSTKPKIFCSDYCRYAWWNKTRNRKPYRLACYCCGKEFISFGNKKKKFCSQECRRTSRYGGETG